MKQGIILYFTGDKKNKSDADYKTAINTLDISADMVEIVSRDTGHYSISDAWWFLTSRGMQEIICQKACFNQTGRIEFFGERLRLCG